MTAKKLEWPLGDAMRQTFEDELAARRITYDRDELGAYRLSCTRTDLTHLQEWISGFTAAFAIKLNVRPWEADVA